MKKIDAQTILQIALIVLVIVYCVYAVSQHKCKKVETFESRKLLERIENFDNGPSDTMLSPVDYGIYKSIIDAYNKVLDRQPTPSELFENFKGIQSSAYDAAKLKSMLLASDEYNRKTMTQNNTSSADVSKSINDQQINDTVTVAYMKANNNQAPSAATVAYLKEQYIASGMNDAALAAIVAQISGEKTPAAPAKGSVVELMSESEPVVESSKPIASSSKSPAASSVSSANAPAASAKPPAASSVSSAKSHAASAKPIAESSVSSAKYPAESTKPIIESSVSSSKYPAASSVSSTKPIAAKASVVELMSSISDETVESTEYSDINQEVTVNPGKHMSLVIQRPSVLNIYTQEKPVISHFSEKPNSYPTYDPSDPISIDNITNTCLSKDAMAANIDKRKENLLAEVKNQRNLSELQYACDRSGGSCANNKENAATYANASSLATSGTAYDKNVTYGNTGLKQLATGSASANRSVAAGRPIFDNADDSGKLYPQYSWMMPMKNLPPPVSTMYSPVEQTALIGTLLNDAKNTKAGSIVAKVPLDTNY